MKHFLPTFFLVIAIFFFYSGRVLAQYDPAITGPIPSPGLLPCSADQTEDPNFNASRPYQASPCGPSPKALMCGNTLRVVEHFNGGTAPAGTPSKVVDLPAGDKDYAASLTGATFPVAGNTELTLNSQNAIDQLSDATKMNEYLNWYLSGVTGKADSGTNTTSQVVDYSGPAKKLLPQIIQEALRIDIIKSPTVQVTYPQDITPVPGQTQAAGTITQQANHNQIVVCYTKTGPHIPYWITNFFGVPAIGFGTETPINCYNGNNTSHLGSVLRLHNWQTDQLLQTIDNAVRDFLTTISSAQILSQVLASAFIDRWDLPIPPLPWSDKNGVPFATADDYNKAYKEWRGEYCAFISLPFINRILVCYGLPGLTNNVYADLYPYVPLSNTVDKDGKTPVTDVGILPGSGVILTDLDAPVYRIIHEPILYYPHTQETSDLLDALNKTYVPQTGTTNDVPPGTTEPVNDPTTGVCKIVTLRTNPGDYLFPEVTPDINEMRVYVNPYTVHILPCHDETRTDGFGNTFTIAVCEGDVTSEFRMKTQVPYADEIFATSTAGNSSDFRKIYPKIGVDTPVTCLTNIPTYTGVTYIPKDNMTGMKVIDPLGTDTTNNSRLYFPHFGSVYDYFLKGIQTALRPQGYADPTPVSGTLCPEATPSPLPQQLRQPL